MAGVEVDADDRILYNNTAGALSYDAHGSGAKAALQFATADTTVALTCPCPLASPPSEARVRR